MKDKVIIGLVVLVVMVSMLGTIAYLRQRLIIVEGERDVYQTSFKQCKEDSNLAKEVSNEYQKQNTTLNNELRDARRMYSNLRFKVNHTPVGHNAATPAGELRESCAIDAGEILDLSEDAERTRLKLIACQKFIDGLSQPEE